MKQHITPKQANELGENMFYELFPDLVRREEWAKYHHKKITIGKLIETIGSYHKIYISGNHDGWKLELFELNERICNEDSCLYERTHKELVTALFGMLLCVIEMKKNRK